MLPPKHIPVDTMSKPLVNDHWEDWDPYALLGKASEATPDVLEEVSDRGVITFAIGCAEWVTYRLSPYLTDQQAWHYLEACWAWVLGATVALPPDPICDEWQVKIHAPIGLSILTVVRCSYLDPLSEGMPSIKDDSIKEVTTNLLPDFTYGKLHYNLGALWSFGRRNICWTDNAKRWRDVTPGELASTH